jgi:hypothetical protein
LAFRLNFKVLFESLGVLISFTHLLEEFLFFLDHLEDVGLHLELFHLLGVLKFKV